MPRRHRTAWAGGGVQTAAPRKIAAGGSVLFGFVGENEIFDDGFEFRPPPPIEDRLWRHPAEIGRVHVPAPPRALRRNPWALGFVSVVGSAVLAGSLMFTAGGIGDEPDQLALRPSASVIDAPIGSDALAGIVGVEVDVDRRGRTGNGMVLADGQHVITSLQLVRPAATDIGAAEVVVIDETGRRHTAQIVATDEHNDLAVIRAEAAMRPFPDTEAATPTVGDTLHLRGGGRGVGLRGWSAGVAGSGTTDPVADLVGVLGLDQGLPASASGAVALDDARRFVGLVSVDLASGRAGLRAAVVVPAARVRHAVDQFLASGTIVHGWLGVEASPGDATRQVALGEGPTVAEVVPASPAEIAGLQPGDVLLRVCGTEVASIDDVVTVMLVTEPGTVCAIDARRGGEPWHTDATVGARAA